MKRSKADLPVLVLCPKEKKVGGEEGGKTVVNKLVLMVWVIPPVSAKKQLIYLPGIN